MTGRGDAGGELPPFPGPPDDPVYLDYNATTPVDPRVVEAMVPYLTGFFGNPSSGHPCGVEPRRALGEARAQVAALIGARTGEMIFTGSSPPRTASRPRRVRPATAAPTPRRRC